MSSGKLKHLYGSKVHNNFGGFLVFRDQLYPTVKGNKLLGLESGNGQARDSLKVGYESLATLQYADSELFTDLFLRIGDLYVELWTEMCRRYGNIFVFFRMGDDLGFMAMVDAAKEIRKLR